MGPALAQWFVFNLLVSLLVAYVAARTIAPGTEYLNVFCTVAAITFLAYAGGRAAGLDLDGQAVGGHGKGDVRRPAVRAGDGGNIWVVVAQIRKACIREKREA